MPSIELKLISDVYFFFRRYIVFHFWSIFVYYDSHKWTYSFFSSLLMTNHPAPNLFGTARDKAELFRERYTILHQVSWRGRKRLFQLRWDSGITKGWAFVLQSLSFSRLLLGSLCLRPSRGYRYKKNTLTIMMMVKIVANIFHMLLICQALFITLQTLLIIWSP